MRKLATVRRISELLPIEGADAIELARIDGWQCVAKKGEFAQGDLCVYFEIDSFLPAVERFEFLRKSSFKRMGEQEGFRIKTIKLRGQLSQGLALPINLFFDDFVGSDYDEGQELSEFFYEGNDITDFLGVVKYEPPVPTQLSGQISGNFPGFLCKTEQERCQNLVSDIFVRNRDALYEVTMKMDGTSFTAFRYEDDSGVCGRNWRLKVDSSNSTNSLVRMYLDSGLEEVLLKYGKNIAVQGELMGPGIQSNRESLPAHTLFIFDIYDINAGTHVDPDTRYQILDDLYALGLDRKLVKHTPVMYISATLASLGITNVHELLKFSEGPSITHPIREGFVYKRMDGKFSFKAISNLYLLKEKD